MKETYSDNANKWTHHQILAKVPHTFNANTKKAEFKGSLS